MCGRYTITLSDEEISDYFHAKFLEEFTPRFNSAPTQLLPVITNDQENVIQLFRWGLIPPWAEDKSIGSKMINSRVETITEKPSFKNAFKKRRCLVIADSYYEWKKDESGKVPYRIKLKDSKVFAFAGIWETWSKEEKINSFSIITTQAEKELSDLHERMPIILPVENMKVWLDNKLDEKTALTILNENVKKGFETYSVSKKVNSPTNDSSELIVKV